MQGDELIDSTRYGARSSSNSGSNSGDTVFTIKDSSHGFAAMTFNEFQATLERNSPPNLPPVLVALWHDAKGNWDAAHETAQAVEDDSGAWVHAYLHRKEGDDSNAAYWYRRAGKPIARDSLPEEWTRIVTTLLEE
jgi:hypothetical protein